MRGDPSAAHRLNTAFRVPGRQRAARSERRSRRC